MTSSVDGSVRLWGSRGAPPPLKKDNLSPTQEGMPRPHVLYLYVYSIGNANNYYNGNDYRQDNKLVVSFNRSFESF